jgi:DNA-directed RNA polymerase specialized sigma24 family protein
MDEIITSLYNSREVAECLHRHFDESCRDDVKQDLFELLINLKSGTLEEINSRGKLKAYVAVIISNLKRQRRGKVAKMVGMYTRFEELPANLEVSDEGYNDLPDIAETKTENLHWYYAGVLKLYAKLGTIAAVSRETKIPYESVKHAIKLAREKIKSEWEK